ncbi:gem-associated protein 2 isoform X1 [Lingula anatina]|uniref:Gem-associated protein 2 n=1 Tax=Lingula anatina TaxID=7574 RepID=A0A1S3H3Z6_LINAN|nr:gem-associated protein 2 isoform X1 [Lingula anatina]|eukprot:XP_013380682.1 gem-associated protein 2 isoform X1 [Lingula anatina]
MRTMNWTFPQPPDKNIYVGCSKYEARKCPQVVVADIDRKAFLRKQTVKVTKSNGCQPAPHGYTEDLHWQETQTANFSDVRQKLVQYKARLKQQTPPPALHYKGAPIKLPQPDYPEGWCRLCFGKFPGQKIDSSTVEEETGDDQEKYPDGTPPLVSIIASMDQPAVLKVLEYHLNWFEATGFSQEQGRWFYALLASLEKPLTPETCSLLRTLARNCSSLRATLPSPQHPLLRPLNLLITLVARYFGQIDLADNG